MCPSANASVNLRIEGKTSTIFEGQVTTTYHRVTTLSGGTRHCNGQNNDNNPCAGPTCTTALDDASKIAGFVFDGKYFESLDDFQITSIGGETPGENEFWAICLNFRLTPVGGCQQIVQQGDQVLFAYAHDFNNANPTKNFLRLYGPTDPVDPGNVTLTVTDGRGVPVENVSVKEATGNPDPKSTDANGKVTFQLQRGRTYKFKADKAYALVSIRSNQLVVITMYH